jgi:hypothetical protein
LRWDVLLLALLGRVGHAFYGQCRDSIHPCSHVIGNFLVVREIPTMGLEVGSTHYYGKVLVQWYFVRSHERRLASREHDMIDDELNVAASLPSAGSLANGKRSIVKILLALNLNYNGTTT